jgi:nucleolar protein 56
LAFRAVHGKRLAKMSQVDYLLHESSVGYAIFQVVHQADTIGNRLKEVQDAGQDLAKFGKMVKLVNFAPYRYDLLRSMK